MRIEINGGMVQLSRYAGSENVDGKRHSKGARIGRFSASALPEFATSESDADPDRIPFEIYRNTTPAEHECIIDFMRKRQLANAIPQLEEALRILERVARFDGLEVTAEIAKRVQSTSRKLNRCVRPSAQQDLLSGAASDEQAEVIACDPAADALPPTTSMHAEARMESVGLASSAG